MAVNYAIIPFALATAVAASSGTVVVGYPNMMNLGGNVLNNASQGSFKISDGNHKLKVGNNIYSAPKDFTLTFNANASNITITNKTAAAWPAGSVCSLQANLNGALRTTTIPLNNPRIVPVREIILDLGSPNTIVTTAVAAAQAVAGAANLTLNGTLVTAGVANFDVPRGVQLVSTNAGDTTQIATVTGKDEYNVTVVEAITLNGTTPVFGKKAFASISRVAMSAATVGNVSCGNSDILGLPLAVRVAGQVVKEMQDGAVATAGTFAFALAGAVSTSTTADTRGTYDPNAACDGSKGFLLTVSLPDPSDVGVAQFGG